MDHGWQSVGVFSVPPRDLRRLIGMLNRQQRGVQRLPLLIETLAGEPRWLLADEPLASLDPLHQLETLALLRDAATRGMGVVVVLHDLTQAAAIADEVLLLKDGRVLAHGVTDRVMTPAHLAAAYGVRVEVLARADGRRVIVPDERL